MRGWGAHAALTMRFEWRHAMAPMTAPTRPRCNQVALQV